MASLFASASMPASPLSFRGLPFTRFYPLEEIGNVWRGERLSFDAFGRVAVVHEGFYGVLNDSTWLDLADKERGTVSMGTIVRGGDGQAYYGAFGSWGSVGSTAGGKLRARPLLPPNPPKWALTTTFVDVIVTPRGVFFGGWNGVVFWDARTRESRFFELSRVTKIFTVGANVYLASHQRDLMRIDLDHSVLRPVEGTMFPDTAIELATALDETRSLVATIDGRVFVFDGTSLTPWLILAREGLTGRMTSLLRMADGGLAIAIVGKGLFLISPQDKVFCALTTSEYHRISDLAAREPGVLWIATEDGVEKVLYGNPLTVFGQRLGIPLSWPMITRWNDKVVVASGGRLYEAKPAGTFSGTRFELVANQPAAGAWALAARGSQLLVGNSDGLFEARADGSFFNVLSGIDVSRLVLIGPELCYVIGREQIAVVRWTGGRWEECAARIPGVGFPSIVHAARESVWIELGANGVARLSLRGGRLCSRVIDEFPWKESRWVNIGIVDDTVAITGPPGGRIYFDEKTESIVRAPPLARVLDQSPKWITRILEDSTGTLWATHDEGVVTFVPRGGGYQIDTTTFDLMNDHYPMVDELPGNDIWFSTGHSLYHVERRRTTEAAHLSRPMLVSIVDGRTGAELLHRRAPGETPLRLRYAENSLSFRFFSGGYAWRRSPVYEFTLHNGQDQWRNVGAGSLLNFPGLREGNYRLEVKRADVRPAERSSAVLEFEILPPWHRTWPAFALYGLLGAFGVFGIVRWTGQRTHRRNLQLEKLVQERTDQLKATMDRLREETRNAATLAERDRLAGEIHDSVQQGLSGMILQLDATLKLPALTSDVRSRLNVARNMVSFTRNEVQHAVWNLESPLLEHTEFGDALRKLTTFISPGTARIDVTVTGTPVSLPPSTKHHLLRIAQEALTNAVRHASPSTIGIHLGYRPDAVSLEVTDDGVGFDPGEAMAPGIGHFGLRGLRSRARETGGELTIRSSPGKGASIAIVVPLPGQPGSSSNAIAPQA